MHYKERIKQTENYKGFKAILPFLMIVAILVSTLVLAQSNLNYEGKNTADGATYTLYSNPGLDTDSTAPTMESYPYMLSDVIFSKSKSSRTADEVDFTVGELLRTETLFDGDTNSGYVTYGNIPFGTKTSWGTTVDGEKANVDGQKLYALLRTYYEYGYLVQMDNSNIFTSGVEQAKALYEGAGVYGKMLNGLMKMTSIGTLLYSTGIGVVDFLYGAVSAFNPIGLMGFAKELALDNNPYIDLAQGWLNKALAPVLKVVGLNVDLILALRLLFAVVIIIVALVTIISLVGRGRNTNSNQGSIGKARILFIRLATMILSIPFMWMGAMVVDELVKGLKDNAELSLMNSTNDVILDTLEFAGYTNMQLPLNTLTVDGSGEKSIIRGAEPTTEFMRDIQANIGQSRSSPVETLEGFNNKVKVNVADYIGIISSAEDGDNIAAKSNSIADFDGKLFSTSNGNGVESSFPYRGDGDGNDSGEIQYSANQPVYFMTTNPTVSKQAASKMLITEIVGGSTAFKQAYFNVDESAIETDDGEDAGIVSKISKALIGAVSEQPRSYRIIDDRYMLSSVNPTIMHRVQWNRPDTYIYGVIPAGGTSDEHKNTENYTHAAGSFQRNNPFTGRPFLDMEDSETLSNLSAQGDDFSAYSDAINAAGEGRKVGPYEVAGAIIEEVQDIESGKKDIDEATMELTEDEFPKAVANMNRNSFFIAMANKYSGISSKGGYAPSLSTQSVSFLLQTTYNGKGKFSYKGYNTIASDAGSTKNKGMNGITFHRYVIPNSGPGDLAAKVVELGVKWAATGVATILAAWYLVRAPFIPAIIKQFQMFFKALLLGDVIAVLGFLLYYGAMKVTFALSYVFIGLASQIGGFVSDLIMLATNVFMGDGFFDKYMEVADSPLGFAAGAATGKTVTVGMSIVSSFASVFLVIVFMILLSWPVYSMPKRNGKERKMSVMEVAMTFVFIAAEDIYENLNSKMQMALYGKQTGGQGNGMLSRLSRRAGGRKVGVREELTGRAKKTANAGGKAALLAASVAVPGSGAAVGGITRGAASLMKAKAGSSSVKALATSGAKKALGNAATKALPGPDGPGGVQGEAGGPPNNTGDQPLTPQEYFNRGQSRSNASDEEVIYNSYAGQTYNDAQLPEPEDDLSKKHQSESETDKAVIHDAEFREVEQPDEQPEEKQPDENVGVINADLDKLKAKELEADKISATDGEVDEQEIDDQNVEDQQTDEQQTDESDTEQENVEGQEVEGQEVDGQDAENQDIDEQDINEQDVDKQDIEDEDVEKSETDEQDVEDEDIKESKIDEQDVEDEDIKESKIDEQDVDGQEIDKQDIDESDTDESDVEKQDVDEEETDESDNPTIVIPPEMSDIDDKDGITQGDGEGENDELDELNVDTVNTDEVDTDELDADELETDDLESDMSTVDKQATNKSMMVDTNMEDLDVDDMDAKDLETEKVDTDGVDTKGLESDKLDAKEVDADEQSINKQDVDGQAVDKQATHQHYVQDSYTAQNETHGMTTGKIDDKDGIAKDGDKSESERGERKDDKDVNHPRAKEFMRNYNGTHYEDDNLRRRNMSDEQRQCTANVMHREGNNTAISDVYKHFETQMANIEDSITKRESKIEANLSKESELKMKLQNGDISQKKYDKEKRNIDLDNGKHAEKISKLVNRMDKMSDRQQVTVNVADKLQGMHDIPGFSQLSGKLDSIVSSGLNDGGTHIRERTERVERIKEKQTGSPQSRRGSSGHNANSNSPDMQQQFDKFLDQFEKSSRQQQQEQFRHNNNMRHAQDGILKENRAMNENLRRNNK